MDESTEEAIVLVDAIAQLWPELSDLIDGERSALEADLLARLRALDSALDNREATSAAETSAAQAAVLAAFHAEPRVYARLMALAEELLGQRDRTAAREPGIPGTITRQRYLEIPVYYATDRAAVSEIDNTTSNGGWFTGDRGDVSFGVVWVSIPDDHRMAALEKPRWWRLEFRQNPERHIVALRLNAASRAEFTQRAAASVAAAAIPEALIFIHGYNVTFVDAGRRAAQIAYDLNFQGLPMLYSWPSEGATLRYAVDGNNAIWTGPHFVEYMRLALTELGARRVHVVAHSMGNRVLTQGLRELSEEEGDRLGQVVFAAPDVDAGVFAQLAADFASGAASYTLYASSKDKALQASRLAAKYPRAGQSGEDIVVVAGVDTIDASELDTGLMSHSYIGDRTSILSDLFYLIGEGVRPDRRFGLQPMTHHNGLGYWVFRARQA